MLNYFHLFQLFQFLGEMTSQGMALS